MFIKTTLESKDFKRITKCVFECNCYMTQIADVLGKMLTSAGFKE